jgi:hypothetical protein
MANDDRLVIEISRKSNTELYYDYSTLISLKKIEAGLYLVGENKISIDSEINSTDELSEFDFIFIDEDEDIASKLKEILESLPPIKTQIAIVCHKGGRSIPSVTAALSNETIISRYRIHKPVEFSHTEHDICSRDGLKPFFDCIANGFKNYTSHFNQLWNCIADPVGLAESLRYKILSPLAALDLLNQSGAEDEKTSELKQNILEDLLDGKGSMVRELCDIIGCDDALNSDLMSLLPGATGVLPQIEHEALKRIAAELDTKISEIKVMLHE